MIETLPPIRRKIEHMPVEDITIDDVFLRLSFNYYSEHEWVEIGNDFELDDDYPIDVTRYRKMCELLHPVIESLVDWTGHEDIIDIFGDDRDNLDTQDLQGIFSWWLGAAALESWKDGAPFLKWNNDAGPLRLAYEEWLRYRLTEQGRSSYQVHSAIFALDMEEFYRDTGVRGQLERYSNFRKNGGTFEDYTTQVLLPEMRHMVVSEAVQNYDETLHTSASSSKEKGSEPFHYFYETCMINKMICNGVSDDEINAYAENVMARAELAEDIRNLPNTHEATDPQKISEVEYLIRYREKCKEWLPDHALLEPIYQYERYGKMPGFQTCTAGWHNGYKDAPLPSKSI